MDQEEESIEIRQPAYQSYKEGVDINSNILPEQGFMLIVGRPGSGKSHLVYELITNHKMYFKKFNFVFFITPGKIGDLNLTKSNSTNQFSLDWIFGKINEVNQQIQMAQQQKKKMKTVNVLFILDDVVGYLQKLRSSPLMMSLVYNRRHLITNGTVTLIITAQYYKAIPRLMRANCTALVLFDLIPEDLKQIRKEVIYCKDSTCIMEIAEKIFAKKHAFLFVRLDTGDMFYNFRKKIYSPQQNELKEYHSKKKSIIEDDQDDDEQYEQLEDKLTKTKIRETKEEKDDFLKELYKKYGLE